MAAWIYKGGQQYFKSGLRGSGSTLAKTSSQYLLDFSATLAVGVGNNSASMNGIIRGVMRGAALTSTAVMMAGVHGVYWITGSNASTWPKAAVLGEIHDGSTGADAGVVSVFLSGNSPTPTSATAYFAGIPIGALGGSTLNYGLDFGNQGPSAISNSFSIGDIRLQNQAVIAGFTTAITANVTTTTTPVGSVGYTTHATGRGVTFYSDGAKWQTSIGQTLSQTSSQFMIDAQPTLAAGVGNNTGSAVGVIRGLMQGANLTSTAVTQGSIYGVYWITGTNASTWPKGALVGEVHDNTTTADAAVMAVLGGDSGAVTTAISAFGVRYTNSTPGNKFTYGLDFGKGVAGFTVPAQYFANADIRFSSGAVFMFGVGVPVNGVSGTGAGFAGPGSQYINTSTGIPYANTNTLASPTWTKVSAT